MSFLKELVSRKSSLKKTETLVTSFDGVQYVETKVDDNFTKTKVKQFAVPFVLDTKPDLQVGMVRHNLFLGSMDAATNLCLLIDLGITHILNVSSDFLEYYPDKFTYEHVGLLDIPEENLLKNFGKCFNYYTSVKNTNGKLLVHCNAGVSRSASIVIALIMEDEKITFNEAYEQVKQQRPSIKLNDGFKFQLQKWKI